MPAISAQEFTSHDFDYLVVGGGTAGLVVAARLSENPNIVVGIIEAGSATFDTLAINVPGRYGESLGTPNDWQFETVPQPGLGGRTLPWPRGKVLGGTSALNFMTWNRPSREDIDAWGDLGNHGWAWDDLLPFYKKTENFIRPDGEHSRKYQSYFDEESLGHGGPLPVAYSKEYSESHQYWHETLTNAGIPTNKSHMAGSNVGAWTNIVTVDPQTSTRAYSATAYYIPNASRPNLKLVTNATVKEILLEQEDKMWVAQGVKFESHGKESTALATREVIVCAGSVLSPQLLELSGIGNASILKSAGIAIRIDNPNVGENLQEHMMTATIYEIDPSIPTPDELRTDTALADKADQTYNTAKAGPRVILPCSIAYVPLSHFMSPDVLRSIASRSQGESLRDQILSRRFEDLARLGQIEYIFDVGNWSPFLKADKHKKYATMLQILQYPFTKGEIHIPAKGDKEGPVPSPQIDPKYYGGARGWLDLEVQVQCARFGQSIAKTPPLAKFIRGQVWPPNGAEMSDEGLRDWVVHNTVTDWHPVGTCAMGGAQGVKAGVVDERLRVYGTRGLRVVDASIMPLQISAHPQATVYAIAEKASSMILEDAK